MEIPTDLCASELSLSEGNLKLNTLTALRNVNTRLRALETATTPAAPNVVFVTYTNANLPPELSATAAPAGPGAGNYLKLTLPDGSVKHYSLSPSSTYAPA